MGKTARLRQMVKEQSTYDAIIRVYKELLKEGDKKKLYFFKSEVYGCLNPNGPKRYWRRADDFLGEKNIDSSIAHTWKAKGDRCFGHKRSECIKRTI